MSTSQKNTYETGLSTSSTTTSSSSDDTYLNRAKSNLEQREDFAGTTYRAIRDNPKTSAAAALGVAAAAAGGAFLWNRKNKLGTAFGHASASDEISNEVSEMNKEAVEMASKSHPSA